MSDDHPIAAMAQAIIDDANKAASEAEAAGLPTDLVNMAMTAVVDPCTTVRDMVRAEPRLTEARGVAAGLTDLLDGAAQVVQALRDDTAAKAASG